MLLVFHNMWSSFYFPPQKPTPSSWAAGVTQNARAYPILDSGTIPVRPHRTTLSHFFRQPGLSGGRARDAWPGLEPWLWPCSWWGLFPYPEFAGRAHMGASSSIEPCLMLQGHMWIQCIKSLGLIYWFQLQISPLFSHPLVTTIWFSAFMS